MHSKNILISGAGIAGTTLAYWLKKFGFNPTIVEYAPKLREGGYAVDFWGAGYLVADKMGIVPQIEQADIGVTELVFVDADNRRKGSMNYLYLKKLMHDEAFTLLRSDLARIIYEQLPSDIEIIFGDSITQLAQNENGVMVSFQHAAPRQFDLVVGADGLHSSVRNLTFGNEAQFEKYFGYYTSSYTILDSPYPEKAFLGYNVPGKQVATYYINKHRSSAFYIFTSPQKLPYAHHDLEAQKQLLRNEFENAGWRCPELLAKMDEAPDFYFDVVSQIMMPRWSDGRVSLVGDACGCPSLLSGQGSTLAMVGAYILAGELKEANGDYKAAFAQYESIFKPFVSSKQKLAQNFAKSLVPKSWFGIWLRNKITSLMFLPFLSKLFIKQFMSDKLKLKDY